MKNISKKSILQLVGTIVLIGGVATCFLLYSLLVGSIIASVFIYGNDIFTPASENPESAYYVGQTMVLLLTNPAFTIPVFVGGVILGDRAVKHAKEGDELRRRENRAVIGGSGEGMTKK